MKVKRNYVKKKKRKGKKERKKKEKMKVKVKDRLKEIRMNEKQKYVKKKER